MTPENSISGYAGNNTGKVNLSEALCTLDLQHNLIDQAMIDSVNPNEFSYSKSYNTVIENEEVADYGNTPINENVILNLIKHLDITIRFLRHDVCKGGKLDLTQLYKILNKLNKNLIRKGKNHASEFNASAWDLNSLITNESESGNYDANTRSGQYTPAKIAGESRSNVPLFLKETSNIEPFRGGMGGMSKMHDALGSKLDMIGNCSQPIESNSERITQIRDQVQIRDKANESRYGEFSQFNINIRDKFGSMSSIFANRPAEYCGPCGGACKCAVGCRCGGCRKCGAPFANFINSYEKRIAPDYTTLNNSMLRKNKNAYSDNLGKLTYYKNPIVGMPFIGDNTVEGIAERDIMHHETPGSIISTFPDNSHYYTVRSGACGGTTPSDDDFFKECTAKDLASEDALSGDPDKMLSCVGECNREPNYMNYYSQIAISSAGGDAYGADFEIPKEKPNKKNYNI
jgi:hypothetical protein